MARVNAGHGLSCYANFIQTRSVVSEILADILYQQTFYRLFINIRYSMMIELQWWEVVNICDFYFCIKINICTKWNFISTLLFTLTYVGRYWWHLIWFYDNVKHIYFLNVYNIRLRLYYGHSNLKCYVRTYLPTNICILCWYY